MFENQEDEEFFSLLANISLTSESTLERLSNFLKVFVKKYFDNQDFTPPENSLEIVTNCILKSEAILYTIYELESKAIKEEEKLELLYYKDIVLKTLVVITNLDFFVNTLKENELFKDAYLLREKLKEEFKLEASKAKINPDTFSKVEVKTSFFREVKPIEHRKTSDISKTEKNIKKSSLNLQLPEIKEAEILENDSLKEAKSRLKLAIERAKEKKLETYIEEEPKIERKTRTAMGWNINPDLLNSDIYK